MLFKRSTTDVSSDKRLAEGLEGGSTDSTDSNAPAERVALRKVDWHIVPLIFLLNMFSFLDRSNIGNARLYGLEGDLALRGNQFQTATSVFFATYVACEVPSTIFLKKLRPARFLSSIAVLWGVVASLTGLTQSYGSLVACRLLLGLAEGPLFPCLTVYLTMFYTRKELAVRFSFLIAGTAIAGAVGGLLAYGIGYMDGLRGLRAWRWLFIIEGLPPICLGIFAWFFLANNPETAWYLTPSERQMLVLRTTRNQPEASTPSAKALHRADVVAALKDWKVWAFCLLNFCADIQLFSFSIFLPTIIQALNPDWSTLYVQALTVPCFAWTALVFCGVAFISDAIQHRAIFGILGSLTSIVGHVMLAAGQGVAARFAGCFVVATGLFVVAGTALVWLPTNLPRYGKRSTAVGMQLMIGNSGGIAAPYLYPTADTPRFVMGHAVTVAMLVVSAMITVVLWWVMVRINERRRAGAEDSKMVGLTEEEVDELGDESPRFVFRT
ncbi:MAG: hypothetical protein Q9208_005407 [Pyrenodesmia sp. 3 TL-2023]